MKLQIPSPIQKIKLKKSAVELHIKRDDLIHPLISGNKWRKLKALVSHYQSSSIITYGGAFSNHLVAIAAYAKSHNLRSKGIIRGKEIDRNNPTLSLCTELGMEIECLDRGSYKELTSTMNEELYDPIKQVLIIPEGGTTTFVKSGMKTLIKELKVQLRDSKKYHVYCSLGTGGTALGIANALSTRDKVHVVPAIKGMTKEALQDKGNRIECTTENAILHYYPEMKKYAAKDIELFLFCEHFYEEYGVLLDPIYTSKVMYFLHTYGELDKQAHNVFIHTGGIQAWKGYFYRYPELHKLLKGISNEISKPLELLL